MSLASIEAYKRAAAATRYGAEGAQDNSLVDDDVIVPNLTNYGLSEAATSETTTSEDEDKINLPGEFRAYPAFSVVERVVSKTHALWHSRIGDYFKCPVNYPLHFYTYDAKRCVLLAPAVSSAQVELVTAFLLMPVSQAEVFNLDLFANEQPDAQALIDNYRQIITWRHKEKLTADINALLSDAKEENPEGQLISIDSLRRFYEFIVANPLLTYPKIALTPDGYMYARWRAAREKLFSAQFLPDGDVRFVIFRPNTKHKNKVTRISGLTTADALIDEIRSHRIADWVLDRYEG